MVRTLIIFLSITKNHRIRNHEFIVTDSNVHPPFTVRCDDEIQTIGKGIARKSPMMTEVMTEIVLLLENNAFQV